VNSSAKLPAAVVLLFGFAVCGAEPIAGSIRTLEGEATLRRGNSTTPVHTGQHLQPGDILRTGAGARLGAILRDGTRISLGGNTEVSIDRFVYEPAQGRFDLLLKLARGVFAYASGKISQFSRDAARVETPVGVVGLRGTHFAISLEGEPGAAP
jgi:hypothetical protein